MNHPFAWSLALASLALAADLRTTTAAATRPTPAAVEILVGGVPQPRYAHSGRWYVEALKGRQYAIRLHNPYGVRVGVALSVDGLNTIDARETTAPGARKWVLGPHETVIISGWQTSRTVARQFQFTTETESYGQALGKTTNLGIISAAFFRERISTRGEPGTTEQPSSDRATPAPPAPSALGKAASADEFAATGMGRRTGHAVTEVWLDLEDRPVQTVDIRYEFRPQLVRLGILPAPRVADPLQRREHAQGFESGFCPEPGGTH